MVERQTNLRSSLSIPLRASPAIQAATSPGFDQEIAMMSKQKGDEVIYGICCPPENSIGGPWAEP